MINIPFTSVIISEVPELIEIKDHIFGDLFGFLDQFFWKGHNMILDQTFFEIEHFTGDDA